VPLPGRRGCAAASLATETNTYSPLRTDFADFEQSFYATPGSHPETPTLCSAVFPALRRRASCGEIELIEGTAAWAEPGGLVNGCGMPTTQMPSSAHRSRTWRFD
jgi:microcystin degradation protein MlrC